MVDCPPNEWQLLLTENEIERCVTKCANLLDQKFDGEKVVVACILKGAVFFHVDLTRKMKIPHSHYFIEARSYQGQVQDSVEILSLIQPEKFVGKKIILIDELFDNGKTLYQVKQAIMEKAEISENNIFTCTLFKKAKPTIYPPPDLIGIEIPDVWVVGYGLDDQQEKRNWLSLWAVPKAEGLEPTPDDERVFGAKYPDVKADLILKSFQ